MNEFGHACHDCVHERDPIFIFGSVIRTLTLGILIFLVALLWAECFKVGLEICHSNVKRHDEFHKWLKFAITATLVAIALSFLVMFFIPGTKW